MLLRIVGLFKPPTTSLTKLDLRDNYLIYLPENIGNLLNLTDLDLADNQLTSLPESFSNLYILTNLDLAGNRLTSLPKSFGNLYTLTNLYLANNQLIILPESIGTLLNLTWLRLSNNLLTRLPKSFSDLDTLVNLELANNQLTRLPENLGNLSNLTRLNLQDNCLIRLPESIGNLLNLTWLDLSNNQLTNLTKSFSNLTNLRVLYLDRNSLIDLSMLQGLSQLKQVRFFDIDLPHRYWTKFSEWEPEWLLDEKNAEIRRMLIEQVGYEKICQELNTIELDTWREYTLLKIDALQLIYINYINNPRNYKLIAEEPMMFLKMTCPSTAHIHILRVPPTITSAEAAIVWVNHGIHPDEFAVQT